MQILLRCTLAAVLASAGLQSQAGPVARWDSVEDVDSVPPRRICPLNMDMVRHSVCEFMVAPFADVLGPIRDKYPRPRLKLEPPRYALVVDAIVSGGKATTRLGYQVLGADLRKMLAGTACGAEDRNHVRVKLGHSMDVTAIEIDTVVRAPSSVVYESACVTAVHIDSAIPIDNSKAIRLVRDLLTSHTETLSRSASDHSDSFLPLGLWGGPSRFPFAIIDGGKVAKTVYVAQASDLEAAGYPISAFVAKTFVPASASTSWTGFDFLPLVLEFENWKLYYAVTSAPTPDATGAVLVNSLLAGLQ